MFMAAQEIPSEDELFQHACEVHELLDGKVATFRTIDFGADKVAPMLPELHAEANPALGLRSIRLCLTNTVRPLFKAQLRALLRASMVGPTKIMFPMISGIRELELAMDVVDEAKDELRQGGEEFDEDVPIGIMIEMPSAAMIADHLAKRVDFFSIGTNDLIQYTLAVDRGNEYVNYLYDPLHPALLRLIDGVVRAGRDEGIPVSICGEMAGDPVVAPVLLGLGVEELSMHAAAVPEIKNVIRSNNLADFEMLATEALKLSCSREIEALAERWERTAHR
jgi:phosphotransferase system enzyme I (PtsI)